MMLASISEVKLYLSMSSYILLLFEAGFAYPLSSLVTFAIFSTTSCILFDRGGFSD
jgi:hypothetical protein